MKQLEKFLEWGGTRREIFCLILSGAALLISMLICSRCLLTRPGLPLYSAAFPLYWRLSWGW